MSDKSTVGARIKAARIEAGLSKRKLADLADVTYWQLHQWETDGHEPTARSLAKLLPHIGGTLDDFFHD